MKKWVSLFFFLTFVLLVFSTSALAQTPDRKVASASTAAADYKLPYPGMLPDNPFYKLKVLRDKIILYLTPDPFKKAQLHLQLADKTLFAALKVAEKGNLPLAIQTAFKGEHQVTQMVDEIKRGVYGGKELDKGLVDKAHKAYTKHQELLDGIMGRANKSEQENLVIIKEFSTRNNNELLKLEKELQEEEETKN